MSEGWVQWNPGQKHHYLSRDVDGWYGTACGAWSADGIGSRKLLDNIPEKRKCKLCIKALQRSDETQSPNQTMNQDERRKSCFGTQSCGTEEYDACPEADECEEVHQKVIK